MRVQVPPPAPRFARAVAPASLTVSHRLKGLTVEVRAGNAIRKYKVVKSDGPDDLVFQGVQSGGPLRDNNNILVRFIKPAARSMEGLNFQPPRLLVLGFETGELAEYALNEEKKEATMLLVPYRRRPRCGWFLSSFLQD